MSPRFSTTWRRVNHVLHKDAEAEAAYKRALAIREKAEGEKPIDIAPTLYNLGVLYLDQGKLADAEPLLKRALTIREKALGADHPDVATSLEALGWLYAKQGKLAEAEPLLKRAISTYESTLGANHPHVARCCAKMAHACCAGQERRGRNLAANKRSRSSKRLRELPTL